jgi:hypothetical protein
MKPESYYYRRILEMSIRIKRTNLGWYVECYDADVIRSEYVFVDIGELKDFLGAKLKESI